MWWNLKISVKIILNPFKSLLKSLVMQYPTNASVMLTNYALFLKMAFLISATTLKDDFLSTKS